MRLPPSMKVCYLPSSSGIVHFSFCAFHLLPHISPVVMLSTIRHSLPFPLSCSKRRRSQLYQEDAASEVKSVKTGNDLAKMATQWVDSKRASKIGQRETTPPDSFNKDHRTVSRTFFTATNSKDKAKVRESSPAVFPNLTAKAKPTGPQRAELIIPSRSEYAAPGRECSTTSSITGKDQFTRHSRYVAPSLTESEASLHSLNRMKVREGFRSRQWDKARNPSRDVSSTRSITPIFEDSERDQEQVCSQIRRKQKASDLRSVRRMDSLHNAPQRAALTSTASTRRRHYAFPALALLADDPESYHRWMQVEQNSTGNTRSSNIQQLSSSPSASAWSSSPTQHCPDVR